MKDLHLCLLLIGLLRCMGSTRAFQTPASVSPRARTKKLLSRLSSDRLCAPDTPLKTRDALEKLKSDFEALRELRPADPFADPSAPLTLISAGSSYTRLWTADTWRAHSRPPHRRYFRHAVRWYYSTTARKIFPMLLIATFWAGTVSVLSRNFGMVRNCLPGTGSSAVLSYLAAPLGLLLTLRTNQSMSRLLEARLAWGRLVLYSRSLANVAAVYLYPLNPGATVLLVRHLATLGWVLKSAVRGESKEGDRTVLYTMLGEGADYDWIVQQPKQTVAILSRMRQIVGTVLTSRVEGSETRVSTSLLVAEEKIANLEQVVGMCERLFVSPIPPTYTRHLSRTMFLWIFFMPAALVSAGLSTFGVMTTTLTATYVLVGLDEVGMEIENSFQLLPLQQLAAAVQTAVETQFFPAGSPMPPVPTK